MKLELSQQIYERQTNTKFHEIRQVEALQFHVDRQTGRWTENHEETNNRFFAIF